MLWMWLIPSGVLMNTFAGHQSSVSCGCFTPDGKNIISASDDGTLIFWNPKTAAPIYSIKRMFFFFFFFFFFFNYIYNKN